jgi:alpha-beta hydrolase superfamily lysophospholipase
MAADARVRRRTVLAALACASGAALLGRHGAALARTSAANDNGVDVDLSFSSGGDTIYGSLRLPSGAGAQPLPAALIIAGSGPTDRNGNSAIENGAIDNLRFVADTLAAAGVISLRYDKLGTGRTGLGTYASHPQDITFDLYVQEALDGLTALASRTEVDASRIEIVGHSEGGLIAVVAAQKLMGSGRPAALTLAEPLAARYLDVLGRQIDEQYDALQQAGQLTQPQVDALKADLVSVIASIRQTGQLPAQSLDPSLRRLLSSNLLFLYTADQYDPLAIAPSLAYLPVLLTHGTKDVQVTTDEVSRLADAFAQGGDNMVEIEEISNMDHVFKDVEGTPDPATDYTNPNLPFSTVFAQRLQNFADKYLGAS